MDHEEAVRKVVATYEKTVEVAEKLLGRSKKKKVSSKSKSTIKTKKKVKR